MENLKSIEEIKKLMGIEDDRIKTWQQLREVIVKNQKPNLAMLTDFYEFTMSQAFFEAGDKDKKVYFDVFFRSNPFGGGYTINGGLEDIIKFISDFHYNEADIEYLRSKGLHEEFLAYLKDLQFNGDVWAIPEGTPIFPNEPVITVRANIIEAQLLESLVLAYFNQHYIKTEKFPKMIGKKISQASKVREDSDYDDEFIPTDEETRLQIVTARELIELVENYLKEKSTPNQ